MAQDLPLTEELSAVFARMSGLLLSEETVSTAVRLVTSLAQDCIPGTVGAGVTLIDEWRGELRDQPGEFCVRRRWFGLMRSGTRRSGIATLHQGIDFDQPRRPRGDLAIDLW